MLKLRQLQKEKQQQLAGQSSAPSAEAQKPIKASQLRLRKDLGSLDVPPCVQVDSSRSDSDSIVFLRISPDEGCYRRGTFNFQLVFKDTYPMDPPKVTLLAKIFHPNIDIQGNVCLNILREDWSPVLDLQSIVIGLLMLLLEPNALDPLNKDAANVLNASRARFEQLVADSMRGSVVDGQYYDRVV
ncbi:LADA_0H11892g1_1 [Lachancea dasiensis]|uniref:NEDD8-conjugating enzyme UBC12 n=1 Tax=Lachancea dasiensis TaxID=1072105 RepID=A0A1G4K3L8_9SACH|nr:LADA_0H11892g1_1 [Lachancea dasiensis]